MTFFIREALRSIRRNAVPSFAAFASVLVTVLVLGVFIPVVQTTTSAANEVRNRIQVGVYLNTATPADIVRVHREIARAPHVGRLHFVSKVQALAQQRKIDPAAYAVVDTNPLPDAFFVTPDRPENSDLVRNELSQSSPLGVRFVTDSAISSVNNRKDQTDKILRVTGIVRITMGLLAGLLVAASLLLVSNTIRLSLFARRREVEVMKLVGATDWFIRWPFVLEGLILGSLGGLAALGILVVAKVLLVDPLVGTIHLFAHSTTFAFPVLLSLLMAAAVAVAAAGSGLSLRRFLRV